MNLNKILCMTEGEEWLGNPGDPRGGPTRRIQQTDSDRVQRSGQGLFQEGKKVKKNN